MMKRNKTILGIGGGLVALAAVGGGVALAQQPRGLAAYDVNGDGKIVSQEILASAKSRFVELDANKDGKLVGEELPRHRGRHGDHGHRGDHGDRGAEQGQPAPAAQPGQAVSAATPVSPHRPTMDASGDGAVNLAEFAAAAQQRASLADTNHDGTISAEELAAIHDRHHGQRDR